MALQPADLPLELFGGAVDHPVIVRARIRIRHAVVIQHQDAGALRPALEQGQQAAAPGELRDPGPLGDRRDFAVPFRHIRLSQ